MEAQNEPAIKLKKSFIEGEVKNIEKWRYNALRSFIESSDKEKYHWNTGEKYGNLIEFAKYISSSKRKWLLKIWLHDLNEAETKNVSTMFIQLLDGKNREIFHISYLANDGWYLSLAGVSILL